MKNTKKLSVILTLSMLASAIPAIATKPNTTTGTTTSTSSTGPNSTTGSTKASGKSAKSSSKFLPGLAKFYVDHEKTAKYAGIALGVPLTGYLAYKFIPGICKFLMPICGLTLLLMEINSSAAKPENKEFTSLFKNIQMKAVTTFQKAKSFFGSFFSK